MPLPNTYWGQHPPVRLDARQFTPLTGLDENVQGWRTRRFGEDASVVAQFRDDKLYCVYFLYGRSCDHVEAQSRYNHLKLVTAKIYGPPSQSQRKPPLTEQDMLLGKFTLVDFWLKLQHTRIAMQCLPQGYTRIWFESAKSTAMP